MAKRDNSINYQSITSRDCTSAMNEIEQNGTTEEPMIIGIDSTTIKFASSDQEIQHETDPQVQNSPNEFTVVFE